MSSLSEILACYRQLASTLTRMVELARAKQWEQLAALDAQCTTIVDQLRDVEGPALSTSERVRMTALASRIRADQDELTGLIRPQFVRLMRNIAQLQREQDLKTADRLPS